MTTITIRLSDDHLRKLQQLADRANLLPEDLVQSSIDEWLSAPDSELVRGADYLLKKNAELYRRLAR